MVNPFFLVSVFVFIGFALESFPAIEGSFGFLSSVFKYSGPILLLGWYFSIGFKRHLPIRKDVITVFLLFLIPITISTIFKGKITFYTIRDILIVLGLLSLFIVKNRVTQRDLNFYFFVAVMIYFFEFVGSGFSYNRNFTILSTFQSNPLFESTMTFVFAIFALFYRKNNNYFLFSMALFLMALSLKRIALVAFFVSIFAEMFLAFFRLQKNKRLLKESYALICISFFILFYLAINIIPIIEWAFRYFNLKYSVNAFTMGRANVAIQLFKFLTKSSLMRELIGYGPGSGSEFIEMIGLKISHLHNDYFKIYYEYGLIGCVLIGSGFLKMFGGYSMNVGIFIFFIFISMTENTFIYISLLYPMYMIFYYNKDRADSVSLIKLQTEVSNEKI